LKIAFNTAFHMTRLSANHNTLSVRFTYCQKKTIQIIQEITLKSTWLSATFLLIVAHHSEAITPVNVVPIFEPITIAIDAGKVIIHELNAASVITHTALLDWIIAVTIIPSTQNFHSERSLYAERSKLALIASTLSFMKSNHKKRSQKPISNFAQLTHFLSLTKISANHQMAIIGIANAEILKSPNQK